MLLLHGWPDDATTWDEVVHYLEDRNVRLIVPTLRGFGETEFKSATAPRTANPGILAMDAIALMDGLGIETFSAVGHDWGSNIAESLAIGWPDRVERIALLSSIPRLGGMPTPPFWHAQLDWYHWFMATKRGAAAIEKDRKAFTRLHWQNWHRMDGLTTQRLNRFLNRSSIPTGWRLLSTAIGRAGTRLSLTRAVSGWKTR